MKCHDLKRKTAQMFDRGGPTRPPLNAVSLYVYHDALDHHRLYNDVCLIFLIITSKTVKTIFSDKP